MKLPTEKILEHAEVVASFFRALVDKGIPVSAAISLAQTYIQTVVLTDITGQEPKKPWEPE